MLPLLDLAAQLSLRGLAITVLVTPNNLPFLQPLLSRFSSIHPLLLPFPTHPSIPAGAENLKDLKDSYFIPMKLALDGLYEPILNWARSHPSPSDAIVSDFFLGWTQRLEDDLGIPRIVFSPSSALSISISHCIWRDVPRRTESLDNRCPIVSSYHPRFAFLPLVPPLHHVPHLHTARRRSRLGAHPRRFPREPAQLGAYFQLIRCSRGIYLEHHRRYLGHPRVWAVGPLTTPEASAADRGGPRSVPVADVRHGWITAQTEAWCTFASEVRRSCRRRRGRRW